MVGIDEEKIFEFEEKDQFEEIINLLTPQYQQLRKANSESLVFLKTACYLGYALFFRGEYQKAEQYLRESVSVTLEKESPEYLRFLAMGHHYLGTLYTLRGKKQEALEHLLKAKRLREALSDRSLWATLNNLAILHETWMEFTKAILRYEDALNKVMETNNHENIVLVLANLARVVFLRGDDDTADAYLTQFQEVLAQHVESHKLRRPMQAWLYFIEGEINQHKGNISDAVVQYQQAIRIFEDCGYHYELYTALNRLSSCLLLRGQTHQAYMLVHRCVAGILDQKLFSILPMTLYMQGEILIEMQLFEEAVKTFDQLEKVSKEYGFQYYEAMSCLGKAKVSWSLENLEKTLACVERALELWRSYDYPVLDQAELFFYYSGILSSLGRHAEAVIALNSANNILLSCTYQPVVHRILSSYFTGYYFYKRQEWIKAIEHFEKSMHLSIRIDQHSMVVRLCFYLIESYLHHVGTTKSGKDRNKQLDKTLGLLTFLRRVLLSSEPSILTPHADIFDLKMKFFIYLMKGSHDLAMHALQKLQTHVQLHHLSQNELEIYNMRILVQNALLSNNNSPDNDMGLSVLTKILEALNGYKHEVNSVIRRRVGLLECNFCGNLINVPLEQLGQNIKQLQFIPSREVLRCPYCMAPGLEMKDLIVPQAIDVARLLDIKNEASHASDSC